LSASTMPSKLYHGFQNIPLTKVSSEVNWRLP
jgi:hypothetical protein